MKNRQKNNLWSIVAIASIMIVVLIPQSAKAGVIFGSNGALGGGFRWDAAPRIINTNERSLDGGLRYSVQGGSLQAYRDLFTWNVLPTVGAFTTAVTQAFNAWASVDSATNLATSLSFVNDTANTAVVGTAGFGGIDFNGAEIDLFGANAGDSGTKGVASFSAALGNVTLTSGTANYGGAQGGGAIRGADVYINANSGAVYTLDLFRRLMTHELGHALGLGDVEDFFNNGFIDDNYNGASSVTALATLTNSWALLVNTANPAASAGLTQFAFGTVANADPGLKTAGVNILMESQGLGIAVGNPVTNLIPLRNDDYGTRQFLYPGPVIPEPSTFAMLLISIVVVSGIVIRKRRGETDHTS